MSEMQQPIKRACMEPETVPAGPMLDEAASNKTCHLQRLDGRLLGLAWPAERVVMGMRVCKKLNQQLLKGARKVVLKSGQAPNPSTRTGQQVCSDLTRFQANGVEVEICAANSSAALLDAVLQGLSMAGNSGWLGKVVQIDLSNCCLGPKHYGQLSLALSASSSSLQHLTLSKNKLRLLGAKTLTTSSDSNTASAPTLLGRSLQQCKLLQHLDLSQSHLGPLGAVFLADVIPSLTSLRCLNLASNQLGDDWAWRWGGAMGGCSELARLDLSANGLGDEGVEWLAGVVGECHGLRELDLSQNNVGSDGAEVLVRVMREHVRVERLDLTRNVNGSFAAGEVDFGRVRELRVGGFVALLDDSIVLEEEAAAASTPEEEEVKGGDREGGAWGEGEGGEEEGEGVKPLSSSRCASRSYASDASQLLFCSAT